MEYDFILVHPSPASILSLSGDAEPCSLLVVRVVNGRQQSKHTLEKQAQAAARIEKYERDLSC